MSNQQRRRIPLNKKNINTKSTNNNAKKSITYQTIDNINKFPKSKIYSSVTDPIPAPFQEPEEPIFDLPAIRERLPAILSKAAELLSSNGKSLLDDPNGQELSLQSSDPILGIILSNRKNKKQLKLGSHTIDIFAKEQKIIPDTPIMKSKLINRLVDKESIQTPAKRISDELIDASSSMKKNRRTLELSGAADTTMELSFEGKAMDKSDLVKLVDSSAIIGDESQLLDMSINQQIDTKNLLQHSNFQF